MADDRDDELRAMAKHRGLKLLKSRRRKPGGDFGRYGLEDGGGKPVLGVADEGLTATADEIAAYLHRAARADWATSAKHLPRVKAPPPPSPKSKPDPKPRPRFKVAVANLFARLPAARRAEAFTELLKRPGVRIERIVSQGQATPEDAPMVQDRDEWVLLLAGEARLRIEDSDVVTLKPGDHLMIAAGQQHWVTRTAPNEATVWLAVHL